MTTNTLKTALLLGLLSAVLLVGGQALGGRQGLYMGLGLAFLMNFGSYFFSDKIALSMYSAQPVSETENPEAYRRVAPIVHGLCHRMELPMPKLYLIPEPSPNAFATGRNPAHASLAFTAGLLQLMNDNEIEGVVAHELGHVLHRDILISSVAGTLAAAITFLARMAFFFGGSREYDADAASAKYVGSPYPLINGLKKLEGWSKSIPMDATPSTAHMFIIKPFHAGGMKTLFSTHPSTEDRIARLQAMR